MFMRAALSSLFSLSRSCFRIFPDETRYVLVGFSAADALNSSSCLAIKSTLPSFEAARSAKLSRILSNET